MGLALPDRVLLGEFDLADPGFWEMPREYRHGAFRTLRDTEGLAFYEERPFDGVPVDPGPGFYAGTRYDDVWNVSRNPTLFCSGKGTNIPDLPVELNEFHGSMINMDDPRHFRLRSIVSKGFTPSVVTSIDGAISVRAAAIVDRVLDKYPDGECDFVEEIASPLPLEIICDMMGVPAEDVDRIFHWANIILGVGDPDFIGDYDGLLTTSLELLAYAQALGEDRRATPTDDITSILMNADVDGERLTPQEFGSFFILLVLAGNATTRNAISHGMLALAQHPDQKALWFGDFEAHAKTAVEEIVRWASPSIHFRRTATEDTEVGGQSIEAGDKVVMFYPSAKSRRAGLRRSVRLRPHPADATPAGRLRSRRPALCLGANFARRQITVMFDEIRRRLPDLRIVGEPAYLLSPFLNGIKRMRCAWS